jgi:hypothetical protein
LHSLLFTIINFVSSQIIPIMSPSSQTSTEFSLSNVLCLDAKKSCSWNSTSLNIKDGLFVKECNNAVVLDLKGEYLALPLFSMESSVCIDQVKSNALDNGTELIFGEKKAQSLSDQLGVWPGLAEQLLLDPGCRNVVDILLSFPTKWGVSVGEKASFFLLNCTVSSLRDTILAYDYKSTIKAVVIDGAFHLARREFAQFSKRISLDRYYLPLDTQHSSPDTKTTLDSIASAIVDLKAGKFVIVVDNLDRENEGDLIIAAEDMTTEKMAFMIKHTGYIFLFSNNLVV